MWMFAFEDMLEVHINDQDVRNKMKQEPYSIVFNNLLLGQNLINLACINQIAELLAGLPEEEVKKISYEYVISKVGEYIDESDNLV